MDAAPLRVGVIGCGPIGTLHAETIRRAPGARVAAVCDVAPDRAAALADRLGGNILAFQSIGELLGRCSLDAVIVATPDHLHVEPALAAIDAGCHVFCEKPLATTPAEAARLVEAAARRGVKLGVDHNRRFGFAYRVAHRLLEERRLGEVRQMTFNVIDRTPRPEVARVPDVILTTLLTHHLDLARWFGGEVASLRTRWFTRADHPIPVLPGVMLTLTFAGGAQAVILAGYYDHQARTEEWTEIWGSLGRVRVMDVVRSAVFWTDGPDSRMVYEPSTFSDEGCFESTIRDHLLAFLACVANGEDPPVTGLDGLRSLELVAAARRSHEERREVLLNEGPDSPRPSRH